MSVILFVFLISSSGFFFYSLVANRLQQAQPLPHTPKPSTNLIQQNISERETLSAPVFYPSYFSEFQPSSYHIFRAVPKTNQTQQASTCLSLPFQQFFWSFQLARGVRFQFVFAYFLILLQIRYESLITIYSYTFNFRYQQENSIKSKIWLTLETNAIPFPLILSICHLSTLRLIDRSPLIELHQLIDSSRLFGSEPDEYNC